MPIRTRRIVVAAVVAAVAGVVALVLVRRPRLTPELRGRAVAVEMGCFACHGPAGTGGVPNPGSDEGEVPAWDGGNAMMYVKNEAEIREWILDGLPARLARRQAERARTSGGGASHDEQDDATPEHDDADDHADADDRGADGDAAGGHRHDDHDEAALEMPAYRDVIGGRDLDDLVAYYRAVAAFDEPPEDAMEGYRVARRVGCFGCHGPGGLVGARNPRAFKGYIPPWRGADYRELVRDDAELEAWIRHGSIPRFERNPLARFFTGRQIIHMPAYDERLTDDEIDALMRYIRWLQSP